jgi:uncharacterized protein YdaU (DUF1376 family)
MKTQNREPPAFQEYAAAMLSRREYRAMGLAERGLLYSLRLECWVNQTVPADPAILAKVLGYSAEEIRAVLPAVMAFFTVAGDELFSPELDDYRAYRARIRNDQIEGGKAGAKLRWKRGEADE